MGALPVTIVLLGEPVAMARARVTIHGTYTPSKQRNAMACIRAEACEAMFGREPLDEPLRMDMRAEFAIPKSMAKRDKPRALLGELRPAKRPDIDNLYKLVADALNTIVFRDDALIVDASLSKFYSNQPKLIITVQPAAAAYIDVTPLCSSDAVTEALQKLPAMLAAEAAE